MRKTGIRRLGRDWGKGIKVELVEAMGWPQLCSGAAEMLDQKTTEEAVADPLISCCCCSNSVSGILHWARWQRCPMPTSAEVLGLALTLAGSASFLSVLKNARETWHMY